MICDDLRVELRTRNNVLWHAVFDSYPSVAEFCRAGQFEDTHVGGYLNLSKSPLLTDKGTDQPRYSRTAVKIASFVGMLTEDLFPAALYARALPRLVIECQSSRFLPLEQARMLALPPGQEDAVFEDDKKRLLAAALRTLTPREEMLMRARFGLDTGEEMKLRELGERFGVCPARAGQIEHKALRKLRHRSRAASLRHLVQQ